MKVIFFVIVLNWNHADFTLECIESLQKCRRNNKYILSIIVVDNCSSDNSINILKKSQYKFKLILNNRNFGWSDGHNVGIKYALKHKADIIMLLANDSTIKKNTIKSLIKVLLKRKKIGIVSPKICVYKTNPPIIMNAGGFLDSKRYFGIDVGNGEIDNGQYDHIKSTDYVVGTAITIKKEVFKKIGYFNKDYFMYYEDADFCFRAKKAGYESQYVQEAIVCHRGAATSVVNSPLHTYYNTRNHLLFIEKYAPFLVKLREQIRMPKTIWEYLISKNKVYKKYSLIGIRDYYLRRFGPHSYCS